MLLRCTRCISKFAHDLLHCPQCGESAENSSPDPNVVGTPAVATDLPVADADEQDAVAPTGRRRAAKAAAMPDPDPASEPVPETELEPAAATAPAPETAPAVEDQPTTEAEAPSTTDTTA